MLCVQFTYIVRIFQCFLFWKELFQSWSYVKSSLSYSCTKSKGFFRGLISIKESSFWSCWKCNFHMTLPLASGPGYFVPKHGNMGQNILGHLSWPSVCQSVCHNIQTGREVPLSCLYWSTCLLIGWSLSCRGNIFLWILWSLILRGAGLSGFRSITQYIFFFFCPFIKYIVQKSLR